MSGECHVEGTVAAAPFTLKLHRGEGMCLLAMNWKGPRPPDDFVGFAIEYMEPGGDRFFVLKNRLGFPGADGKLDPNQLSTKLSPVQKFRWIHFPRNAAKTGEFAYRVTPVFMNERNELSYGVAQEASIALMRETYPGKLDVGFTRGFVSSQALAERWAKTDKEMQTLMPDVAAKGLDFTPTHPDAENAYEWMGFEARKAILDLLDAAIADPDAQVRAVAFDMNLPDVVNRLVKLGDRLKVIIDDSDDHEKAGAAENEAAQRLAASAGAANVKRQHMGGLQHNKFIVADGPKVQTAVCGSTNFSWRGFYIQANNAVTVCGPTAVKLFRDAFDAYWASNAPGAFGKGRTARWHELGLEGIEAKVAFSPHGPSNALLKSIADDIKTAGSSLLYAMAFLYQTPGPILEAVKEVTNRDDCFVYGMSDRDVKTIELQKPDGNIAPVRPEALMRNVPPPFSQEPTGGQGVRLHHKFAVIDFNTPNARVYLGSYNFSSAADVKNGENLVLIRDQRVATAYAVEALGLFDHYHFRVASSDDTGEPKPLMLKRPPRAGGEVAWFAQDYEVPYRIRDRELFA